MCSITTTEKISLCPKCGERFEAVSYHEGTNLVDVDLVTGERREQSAPYMGHEPVVYHYRHHFQ